MERPPEENGDNQYCKHGIEALFELFGHGEFLFGSVMDALLSGFLGGSGEFLFGAEEDGEGDEHGGHRGDEAVVDTGVEDVEVVLAEFLCGHSVGGNGDIHGGEEFGHLGHCFVAQSTTGGNKLMAEGGKVGVVLKAILAQPPAAEQGGDKRSNQSANVDEHVENLETAVAFVFGNAEGFFAVFGSFDFEVVVHLSYNGLEVAFEQAVTEGDEEQGYASEGEQPANVAGGGQDGDGQNDIAGCHDEQTGLDSPFVVLSAVGYDTANQTQDVDTHIEYGVD